MWSGRTPKLIQRRGVRLAQMRVVSQKIVADVLAQLDEAGKAATLQVQGHQVEATSLDKVFWPKVGRRRALTKRDLLRYYAQVSPWLLPHLTGRPLFLTRFPDGISGKSFFQKHWDNPPEFARRVEIYSSSGGEDGEYLICENLPTLLWLGQMAGLELHAWFSRVDAGPDVRKRGRKFTGSEEALERSVLNYPDFIVFDLDPYLYSGREARGEEPELNRRAFARARTLALRIRDILDEIGLTTFVKTSGRTGLHLYLPIVRDLDYDGTREVAATIARRIVQERPKEVTIEWSVRARRGKIFFDYNQNSRGKSLAVPFSPRRHPAATVSATLAWDELMEVYPTDFTLLTMPERLEKEGDPWAAILDARQSLPGAIGGPRSR
ncbi:MAG: non-homologous end-joining DNA ligase [Gemmatimonadales bacterium]